MPTSVTLIEVQYHKPGPLTRVGSGEVRLRKTVCRRLKPTGSRPTGIRTPVRINPHFSSI